MDLPDSPTIPKELLSSVDPIEENPFPDHDHRHEVWENATRNAEDALHLLNSDLAKPRFDSVDAWFSWVCDLTVRKFDIWANRGVSVVLSDDAARDYDKWVHSYANSWILTFHDFYKSKRSGNLLQELQLRLLSRVEWWKVAARSFGPKQKVDTDGIQKHPMVARETPQAKQGSDVSSVPEVPNPRHKEKPTPSGQKKRGKPTNEKLNEAVLRIIHECGEPMAEHLEKIAERLEEERQKDHRLNVTIKYTGKPIDLDAATWTNAYAFDPGGFKKFLYDRLRRTRVATPDAPRNSIRGNTR